MRAIIGKRICLTMILLSCLLTGMEQASAAVPKSFEIFFTADMKRTDGLFPVYEEGAKIYIEIPDELLGKEIMIAAYEQNGAGGKGSILGGAGVYNFTLGHDHSLLLNKNIFADRVTNPRSELAGVMEEITLQPVHAVYPIAAYNADSTGYIIDVTRQLKVNDEWFLLQGHGNPDESKAYISGVSPFEDGVKFSIARAFKVTRRSLQARMDAPSVEGFIELGIDCVIRILPENGFKMRMADPNIGYRTISFMDYGANPHMPVKRSIISRWNLGIRAGDIKYYKQGKAVFPKDPIIFYIDETCPEKLIPYITRGVLDWNNAFEKAGYKQALRVVVAKKGQNLSLERAAIHYHFEGIAKTQNIVHPNTGEILYSRIGISHNLLADYMQNYLFQCGALDKRIVDDMYQEEILGEILRCIVSRCVGESIGLLPNQAANHAFTTEQLRNPGWVKKHGISASITDVLVFNYVAQPEDKIPTIDLFPKIGCYDHWAIEWGYREFPSAGSIAEEAGLLKQIAQRRSSDPTLLFLNAGDIRTQKWTLSSDYALSAEYAIENLKRIYPQLEKASRKMTDREDYWNNYKELYKYVMLYYTRCIRNGYEAIGAGYRDTIPPVSHGWTDKSMQKRAFELIRTNLFSGVPEWLETDFIRRSQIVSPNPEVKSTALKTIENLLSPGRVEGLLAAEKKLGNDAYTVDEYLSDIHSSLFDGFDPAAAITPFRMEMQKTYVTSLLGLVTKNELKKSANEYAFVVLKELELLRGKLYGLQEYHSDPLIKMYYRLLVDRIDSEV